MVSRLELHHVKEYKKKSLKDQKYIKRTISNDYFKACGRSFSASIISEKELSGVVHLYKKTAKG